MGAVSLAGALRTHASSINSLKLSRNCIGDAGVVQLAAALRVTSSLTSLSLAYNGVGDAGAAALSHALRVNTSLLHLDLAHNRVRAAAAALLCAAASSLTSLSLKYNQLGSVWPLLPDPLRIHASIAHLDLESNRLGTAQASL